MSIFNRDRIGASVFCKVSRYKTIRYGYVKWTHAKKGQVVRSLESIGHGRLKGPWVVEAVDVPFTA